MRTVPKNSHGFVYLLPPGVPIMDAHGTAHSRTHRPSVDRHLAPVSARRGPAGEEMTLMDWIGLGLAIALAVYLFIALLLPEKFE